jgi:hypothetical protein
MRCLILQTFTTGGDQSYPDCWALIDDPQYLRYKIPTVAHEPFVERMVEAVPLMSDKICTHMLLRVALRDSDSRPWSVAVRPES